MTHCLRLIPTLPKEIVSKVKKLLLKQFFPFLFFFVFCSFFTERLTSKWLFSWYFLEHFIFYEQFEALPTKACSKVHVSN